jgi:hypothetical protein
MITLAARLGYGLTLERSAAAATIQCYNVGIGTAEHLQFDGVTKAGVRFNKGSDGLDTKGTEMRK